MRFLPVLMLVLLAVLPAYVGSLWTGVASLALASDAAPASHDAPAAAAPSAPAEHAPAAEAAAPAEGAAANKDAAAADSSFDPLTLTKPEIDLLRQLAKRRDELDARAKALDDREALRPRSRKSPSRSSRCSR
jgi:hypothetical protein